MKTIPLLLGFVVGASAASSQTPDPANAAAQARRTLHRIVAHDQGMVRVHAAEVLIWYGESVPMRKLFLGELAADEATAYRTGVWRALAAAAPTPAERSVWVGKIEQVYFDSAVPDHRQATEALGKLGQPLSGAALETARQRARAGADGVLPCWALALAGEPEGWRRLTDMLKSPDDRLRMLTAFALSWLRPKDPAILRALARAADRERPGTAAYPYLLSTALGLDADPARAAAWQAAFDRVLPTLSAEATYDSFHALLPRRTPADIARVLPLLHAAEGDTRTAAAWTLLDIARRASNTGQPDEYTL